MLVIAGGIPAVLVMVTGTIGKSEVSDFGVGRSSFGGLCCTSAVHFEMLVFQSCRWLVGAYLSGPRLFGGIFHDLL